MTTLEELFALGKEVRAKYVTKQALERKGYDLDSLIKIARRTLEEGGKGYKYPLKEFAEVIGFEPKGRIKREDKIAETNISLPNDLRNFIEKKRIEGFDDTVRIRMDREGMVIVEPYKRYLERLEKKKRGKKEKE